MGMIAIKKGARPSEVKIFINKKLYTMSISPGFLRKYNYNNINAKYIRLGLDKDNNEIGIEFLKEDDKSGEVMKLTYTSSGTAASFPIRSLITMFSLNIKDIAGVYREKAINGPKNIENFSKNGFILKINNRET